MQMYGLHFYSITERHNIDKHRMLEKHGDLYDMNDFMHDKSPYLTNYVRPLLMGTPEVTLESSPSKEATVEPTTEHMETAGKQGGSILGFDEFSSNETLISGVGLRLTREDFAEQQSPVHQPAVAPAEVDAGVPQSNSPVQKRKFKGKEIMMESGDVLLDLSDMSNSYSDMPNPPFDKGEVEQACTSGGIRPMADNLAGPSSTSTMPTGSVTVKQERTGFWEQRDKERAEKQKEDEAERARMKAMEEKLQMLWRENTSLRSLSQVPEASQDTMSDAQIRRPTPADPQVFSSLVGMPCSQGDLRVEHNTSYADNMQPHNEAESSSPAMEGGPSLVLERNPRVEDPSPSLAFPGIEDESVPETQKPRTTEAAPSTMDASPNRISQIRSTSGEVNEDVDYGDGLDDSEDVQVFKVQGQRQHLRTWTNHVQMKERRYAHLVHLIHMGFFEKGVL